MCVFVREWLEGFECWKSRFGIWDWWNYLMNHTLVLNSLFSSSPASIPNSSSSYFSKGSSANDKCWLRINEERNQRRQLKFIIWKINLYFTLKKNPSLAKRNVSARLWCNSWFSSRLIMFKRCRFGLSVQSTKFEHNVVSGRECVRNLNLRGQVNPGEIWV